MPVTAMFQPAADSFGDFTIARAPGHTLSPEIETKKAARRQFLIGMGFVAGLIATLGVLAVVDATLYPAAHLTAEEVAAFATSFD